MRTLKWNVRCGICSESASLASKIGLGERDFGHESDPQVRLVAIRKIVVHPHYSPSGMLNDIALIQLKRPVEWNEFLQPVCLPSADDGELGGLLATVSGWGKTESGKYKNKNKNTNTNINC